MKKDDFKKLKPISKEEISADISAEEAGILMYVP